MMKYDMNNLSVKNTVLLCIDYQEKLLSKISDEEKIKEKIMIMVKSAQILEIPIVITEQYPKGLGSTFLELKNILKDQKLIEKIHFNCFRDINFLDKLTNIDRENLLISGIEAHICILQTALAALNRGYRVYLIEDTISSRSIEDKDIAFKRLAQAGAIPSSVEMILYELLGQAGSTTFKSILKLIK